MRMKGRGMTSFAATDDIIAVVVARPSHIAAPVVV